MFIKLQALVEELALELQATDEEGRLLSLGDSRACKTTFPPSAPASDSETDELKLTDELVLTKRRRTLKEGREKRRQGLLHISEDIINQNNIEATVQAGARA
jgi:hypothetical protein